MSLAPPCHSVPPLSPDQPPPHGPGPPSPPVPPPILFLFCLGVFRSWSLRFSLIIPVYVPLSCVLNSYVEMYSSIVSLPSSCVQCPCLPCLLPYLPLLDIMPANHPHLTHVSPWLTYVYPCISVVFCQSLLLYVFSKLLPPPVCGLYSCFRSGFSMLVFF